MKVTPEFVREWREHTRKIKIMQAEEHEMRQAIAAALFEKKKGTQKVLLGDLEVKQTLLERWSVDPAIREVADALSYEAKSAVTWKPSLSLGAYNKLAKDKKAELAPYLTMKYGAPSISVYDLEPE